MGYQEDQEDEPMQDPRSGSEHGLDLPKAILNIGFHSNTLHPLLLILQLMKSKQGEQW